MDVCITYYLQSFWIIWGQTFLSHTRYQLHVLNGKLWRQVTIKLATPIQRPNACWQAARAETVSFFARHDHEANKMPQTSKGRHLGFGRCVIVSSCSAQVFTEKKWNRTTSRKIRPGREALFPCRLWLGHLPAEHKRRQETDPTVFVSCRRVDSKPRRHFVPCRMSADVRETWKSCQCKEYHPVATG